jgi:hypothetical protein
LSFSGINKILKQREKESGWDLTQETKDERERERERKTQKKRKGQIDNKRKKSCRERNRESTKRD